MIGAVSNCEYPTSCKVSSMLHYKLIHFIRMSRIEEEKRVVEQMIRLYCRKCEGHDELCPSCKELLDYAHSRLERCRYGEHKPTCKKCPVHCYRPNMKERIRMVMRWSGPRMIIYHPIAAIQHLIREIIARRKDCWTWWMPSYSLPPRKAIIVYARGIPLKQLSCMPVGLTSIEKSNANLPSFARKQKF